mgnify:CR=1 FL=1
MQDLSLDKLISLYKSTRKLQGEYDYLLKIREDIGNSEDFFDIIHNDASLFSKYLHEEQRMYLQNLESLLTDDKHDEDEILELIEDQNYNHIDFLAETEIMFQQILQFDDKEFKNSEKLIISLLTKYEDLKQKCKDKYNFQ